MVERPDDHWPPLPQPGSRGRRPALETGRVLLARKLIRRRAAAGWTQADLARRARLRVETVSRLEAGKHKPHHATLAKLDDALRRARY